MLNKKHINLVSSQEKIFNVILLLPNLEKSVTLSLSHFSLLYSVFPLFYLYSTIMFDIYFFHNKLFFNIFIIDDSLYRLVIDLVKMVSYITFMLCKLLVACH